IKVYPGLWLGARPTKDDVQFLQENNITAILTVERTALTDHCFSYFDRKFIFACDSTKEVLLEHFEDAFNFIDENIENGVLVHCHFGKSRSATIVVAYLMKKLRIPFVKAFKRVCRSRIISPNAGFRFQLALFEKTRFKAGKAAKKYKNSKLLRKLRKANVNVKVVE
ncbi:unnamed protein product, partial [Hymenolepis diminuta]